MKKGQNTNYEKDYFQTGLSHKVSYTELLASLKQKSQAHKKAKNISRNKKKKRK